MKKIIYSLAIVLLGMTSCTSFDDEHSVNYGDGPAVSIDLTTTTDSTFTFTVNPAEGTQYYAYSVVEGEEAQDVSESSVLKKNLGGISEAIVKYADAQSVTIDMRNAKKQPLCEPNTSYVIYAVAANDKGVTGLVKSLVVKTTDGKAPVLMPYEAKDPTDANDTTTMVTFSENVALGQGTVSASYFQEWGDGEPIAIPAEDINVATNGKNVTFSVNNVPAGAYVMYSWTEGAFVDSFGNKCPAVKTQITDEGIAGVYKRLPFVTWDITADNFTDKAGSLISDYKTFKGTLVFDQNIYRNDEEVKTGDISVIYSSSKKVTTIALTANQWSVSGKTLTFTLPELPAAGDIITVSIKANAITDINGNGNNAYTSTSKTMWWKYFAMTKDMALGTFDFSFTTAKGTYQYGTITITENPEVKNGLIIKNLFLDGSEVEGRYVTAMLNILYMIYYQLFADWRYWQNISFFKYEGGNELFLVFLSIHIIPILTQWIIFLFLHLFLFCFGGDTLHHVRIIDDVFFQNVMESWLLGDDVDALMGGYDMPAKGRKKVDASHRGVELLGSCRIVFFCDGFDIISPEVGTQEIFG